MMRDNTPKHFILCYPPPRTALAQSMFACCGAPRAHISVAGNPLIERRFSDGSPDLEIPLLHELRNRHVVYLADWSSPERVYIDMCFLIPIAELRPATLTILIPFMPSGTMERETAPGVVVTANVEARLLSSLPNMPIIVTVDLHTMQNQFYFYHATPVLFSMMPHIASTFLGTPVIVFPDEGAKKRFGSYFVKSSYTVVACSKERGPGDKRTIRLCDNGGELVRGRRVLIVDDLVRTGGTLRECALMVRASGALAVEIFVTHAAFVNEAAIDAFATQPPIADAFWTTDSVTKWMARLDATPNFHVISLGVHLVAAL